MIANAFVGMLFRKAFGELFAKAGPGHQAPEIVGFSPGHICLVERGRPDTCLLVQHTAGGEEQIQSILFDKLKLPVFGDLIRKVAVARFSRTLGTLLKSGVPLMGALEIVRDSIGNLVVASAMEDLRIAVSEGEGLAKPLERAGVFPPMVTQMVAIGEETGAIDAMLEKIADFYDEEVEAAVHALTSMLEPLMMVLIGGIVGSIVVGMYLPIFDIVNKIK